MSPHQPQEVPIAYTRDTAAALSGISARTLKRWAAGLYRPHYASGMYSFRDIVALRTLAILKDRGIPTRELRRAGEALARQYESPWSRLRFYTDGKSLYFREPGSGHRLATKPYRQMPGPVLELKAVAREVEAAARSLSQRPAEARGKTESVRGVQGGRQVIAGTRITTAAIWACFEEGLSIEQTITQYPQLTEDDVRAALQYERRRRKTAA